MKVYLDHASTTPCDHEVLRTMEPFWNGVFGNPASAHSFGQEAKSAVEHARCQVARLINANPDSISFTSGATEANNILLQGAVFKQCCDIITTNVEHSSILNCIKNLKCRNDYYKTIYLKIDKQGELDLKQLEKAIRASKNTLVVSVMGANNEIGTIYDLEKIGNICKHYNAFFHTDVTQAIGFIDIDVEKLNIDALSFSSHKIYGPKGAGAIFVKNSDKIAPLINGGLQEKFTSGTVNVPSIVGFGKACDLLRYNRDQRRQHCVKIRRRLLDNIMSSLDNISINGTMYNRLPNNINLNIRNINAEALVLGMNDVILSTGSACTSGNPEPSHVIQALGVSNPESSIRITLGKDNTIEEIDYASRKIVNVIKELRNYE